MVLGYKTYFQAIDCSEFLCVWLDIFMDGKNYHINYEIYKKINVRSKNLFG